MIGEYLPDLWHIEVWHLIVPALHGIGAITSIHAVMKTRTSQGAIAWALALITLPYVTLPLYLVFGRNRFHGYVEARREEGQKITKLRASMADASRDVSALPRSVPEAYQLFNQLAHTP